MITKNYQKIERIVALQALPGETVQAAAAVRSGCHGRPRPKFDDFFGLRVDRPGAKKKEGNFCDWHENCH
jgi:hypothetical protein